MPFAHAPLAHSLLLEQLAPFGSPVPVLQVPFVQIPLAHSALEAQALPEGAPWPLPTQAFDWHTPLAQSAPLVHCPPAGWPLAQ
jgi:hypothetical protein